MVAYLYRMPYGIPGSVNRIESATVQSAIIDTTLPPLRFGDPVKLTAAGAVTPIASGDAASLVWGFAVRSYPNQTGTSWPNVALTTSTPGVPPTSGPLDLLRRGFIIVKVNAATAATPGSAVYVRVADATADTPIGGIEAGADGGDCVAIPGCRFVSAQDSNGIAEIEVFIGPIT